MSRFNKYIEEKCGGKKKKKKVDEGQTSVTAKNLKKGMKIHKFGKVDHVSKQNHIIIAYSGRNKKKYDETEAVTIDENVNEDLAQQIAKKMKNEFNKIAGEKVEVDFIGGAIYGYCSELGTYRLFLKYTNKGKNNPGGKFDYGYSSNLKKYYFRMEVKI